MGTAILFVLVVIETLFLGWAITTKDPRKREKAIASLALLALLLLLLATGVLTWGFRYSTFLAVLMVQAVMAILTLRKKSEPAFSLKNAILGYAGNVLLFTFVLFPAILFPQFTPSAVSGAYPVVTARYSWMDPSRIETFSRTGENRKLTVEFWYPEETGNAFPLVVYSHGAFGYSGSNQSTFAELASQGYVVASIGHTYHAFFTKDTDNNITPVDMAFLQQASALNATHTTGNEKEVFDTTSAWMKLRTDDESFVLDSILAECAKINPDPIFQVINPERIGLFGHSLGGAASAQTGRLRKDIDAVIVLDGTMLGEEVAFQDNTVVLNETPYPVPLLNLYAQDHYEDAQAFEGAAYANFHATQQAVAAYETVFKGAGHLNFTDLPLFSPMLANLLGAGTMDAREGIDTMNRVILSFFDHTLKDAEMPVIAPEYGK